MTDVPEKKKKYQVYSKKLAQKVLDKYLQPGMTLKKIGSLQHFPHFRTLYRWRQHHPEFAEALEEARKIKAEEYADQALEIADKVRHKTQVPAAKLKIDTLKWRSGVDNPSRFANKQVIEGNPDKPITILVDTGIRRELPNGQSKQEKVIEAEVTSREGSRPQEGGSGGGEGPSQGQETRGQSSGSQEEKTG